MSVRFTMSGRRLVLAVIARQIEPGSRGLDVGGGEGQLLAELEAQRDVDARGLELDSELVERGVSRGLSVVQGDANCDLRDYPDRAFDYAILSQTLQTAQRPDLRSEEHTSELQSLMRSSYAVFCLKKKQTK